MGCLLLPHEAGLLLGMGLVQVEAAYAPQVLASAYQRVQVLSNRTHAHDQVPSALPLQVGDGVIVVCREMNHLAMGASSVSCFNHDCHPRATCIEH